MAQPAQPQPKTGTAVAASATIAAAFRRYDAEFQAVTRRAKSRFENRDWHGMLADATERLDLYARVLDELEVDVRALLGSELSNRGAWAAMKANYSELIGDEVEWELAETFFNSLTRRIFATEGVDTNIEFVDSDFAAPPREVAPGLCRVYGGSDLRSTVAKILRDAWFEVPFANAERDVDLVSRRITEALEAAGELQSVELIGKPFFRRKGAYLVGRIVTESRSLPLALAILNSGDGIFVDAVLTDEDDISIVFSFTRSHFHVDLAPAYEVVRYLKRLMPRKPVAEIYIALGYHKHGKTELYRALLRQLRETDDRFDFAPGTPGMVMVVFTMPRYDVVLKLIRNRFPAVKLGTENAVRDNYRLVFRHDRAGRLVEAQEFEHLKFDAGRFAPELLGELQRDASRTATVTDNEVVIHHAYLERRVIPLDVYLRNASEEAARDAVIDFGQAVKDLAANGIFPGELLPKNFGVTRHGRVVCYDYDELGLLTDFTFRAMPTSSVEDDELSDEAWFGAGPRDLFPEEFRRFLGLPIELQDAFDQAHSDLFDVAFWTDMQLRVTRGEIIDIFPYASARRLRD